MRTSQPLCCDTGKGFLREAMPRSGPRSSHARFAPLPSSLVNGNLAELLREAVLGAEPGVPSCPSGGSTELTGGHHGRGSTSPRATRSPSLSPPPPAPGPSARGWDSAYPGSEPRAGQGSAGAQDQHASGFLVEVMHVQCVPSFQTRGKPGPSLRLLLSPPCPRFPAAAWDTRLNKAVGVEALPKAAA